MPDFARLLESTFKLGTANIQIITGNIADPPVKIDAIVSTDDNYLTMGSGVSKALREAAQDEAYIRSAQTQSPVTAGTVVVTEPFGLRIHDVKWVLHGTVIDYDTADRPLEELVGQTTANCLAIAEKLQAKRILFPAFATGSGGLLMDVCARWMCNAIKTFLAQDRFVESIYIILPKVESEDTGKKYQHFLRGVNLVLGTPYNPATEARQSWDFYGREKALEQLTAVVTGQRDDGHGKRHAVILGGPRLGKRALLDQIFHRARENGGYIDSKQYVARLSFGRVHRNTPPSFIYRKFLAALAEFEEDESLLEAIRITYANPKLNCQGFLTFLDKHAHRYSEIVFLVDRLPLLLQIDTGDQVQQAKDVRAFWTDLDRLQGQVRFVYTAQDEEYERLRRERLEPLTSTFHKNIEEVRLTCFEKQECETWINRMFRHYLWNSRDASSTIHNFFEHEAGFHPYLIGLLGYALVDSLKQRAIHDPERYPAKYTGWLLEPFFIQALQAIDRPRRRFFDQLFATCTEEEQLDLEALVTATIAQNKQYALLKAMPDTEERASRYQELTAVVDRHRLRLHPDRLKRLQTRGMVVRADSASTVEFMSASLAAYVAERLGVAPSQDRGAPSRDAKPQLEDEPHRFKDVTITLFRPEPKPPAGGSAVHSPKRSEIMALFKGPGAIIDSNLANLPEERQREFLEEWYRCVGYLKKERGHTLPELFTDPLEAGDHILDNYTTAAIRDYVRKLPKGCTISLEVDDDLKSIPWELMLESSCGEEIPFCIGRSVVGQRSSRSRPAMRGRDKIKALLIGDPTDDIEGAQLEVNEIATQLRDSGRFEPIVRLGSVDCTRSKLLRDLRKRDYGLIHYSGHSHFEGSQSAWQLQDGTGIYTDELRAVLEEQPPVLVFSSSCESAKAGATGPITYEFQTFDLASAFLTAGAEAYIGTMWHVGSVVAREFSRVFYRAFLGGELLGECMRRAKQASREHEKLTLVPEAYLSPIDSLAYVLYGDPCMRPGDLFPALQLQQRETSD